MCAVDAAKPGGSIGQPSSSTCKGGTPTFAKLPVVISEPPRSMSSSSALTSLEQRGHMGNSSDMFRFGPSSSVGWEDASPDMST